MMKKAMALALVCICLFGCLPNAAAASDKLTNAKSAGGGVWMHAYREYLDSCGMDFINVAILDLQLDGEPELLCIESAAHVGCSASIVQYDPHSDSYTIVERLNIFGWNSYFELYNTSQGLCWYEYYQYAIAGDDFTAVYKLNFDSNLNKNEEEIVACSIAGFDTDSPQYSYRVNGVSASQSEYDSAYEKLKKMNALYVYDQQAYTYPDDWNAICSDYTIVKTAQNSSAINSPSDEMQSGTAEMGSLAKKWGELKGCTSELKSRFSSLNARYGDVDISWSPYERGSSIDVDVGQSFIQWEHEYDSVGYPNPFFEFLALAYGVDDFDMQTTTVEMIDSEMHGWSQQPDGSAAVTEEFYLFEVYETRINEGNRLLVHMYWDMYQGWDDRYEVALYFESSNSGSTNVTGSQAYDVLGSAEGMYVINCQNWVSLRQWPDTSATRLAEVPLGAYVEQCSILSNGFTQCSYNGKTGYILSDYLGYSRQDSSDDSSYGSSMNYMGDMYVINCQNWVSLREKPSTSATRLAEVPLGAYVSDCYEIPSSGFIRCEYNGLTGYILSEYLGYTSPLDFEEDDYEYENDFVFDGGMSYVGDMYVVNCKNWVSLRQQPDTSSIRLAEVPLGAHVSECYVLYGYGFTLCQYNGILGYILTDYLSTEPESMERVEDGSCAGSLVFTTTGANIRSGPGRSYAILGDVSEGTCFSHLGTGYDERGYAWYKVDYYGRVGWVSSVVSELG